MSISLRWTSGRLGRPSTPSVRPSNHGSVIPAGLRVSRAEFEANLHEKLSDSSFLNDTAPLLAPGVPWDVADAARYVREELVARLPGDAWKGDPPR